MGPVTNVVLFDKEADGVASVRYANAEAAMACVSVCCPLEEIGRLFISVQRRSITTNSNLGNEWPSFFRNDR